MKTKSNSDPKAHIKSAADPKNQELMLDLQRTRADFENYRKNVDEDKVRIKKLVERSTIAKLLPIIDDIDRALSHMPTNLANNPWAKGVASLDKKLTTGLKELGITKIEAQPGTVFNPEFHEAVMVEDGPGENEVIVEELRAGYMIAGEVIRHSSVKVGHQ